VSKPRGAVQYAYNNKIIILADYETEIKIALGEPNPLILEELENILGPKKRIKFYLANPFEVESFLGGFHDPYSSNFYR